MTIEETNEFIKNYIQKDKSNRAIMLSSPWGSGKTFYVKEILVPFLKKPPKEIDCIYISLYEINNLSDLNKSIFIEAKSKNDNPVSETKAKMNIIGKTVVKNIIGHFGIDLSVEDDDMNKLYKSINLYNRLIIFDDLERSRINILELLGFINNLCEHDNAKVLIVANEQEIERYEQNEQDNEDEQKNTTLTEKGRQYVRIKEKTICDTIKFVGDVKKTIEGILGKYDNKYFQEFSKVADDNIVDKISSIMNNNGSHNYRSFLSACQKTNDFIEKLKGDYDKKFIENLFLGTVTYLTKGKEEHWKIDDKYTSYELGSFDYPLYRVMYDYIDTQNFNVEIVKKTQEIFLENQNKSVLDSYVTKIYNFSKYTEEDVVEAIDKLEEGLNNNHLSSSKYIEVANYLIKVGNIINYNDKIEKCLDLMVDKAKIEAANGKRISTELFHGIELYNEEINKFNEFKKRMEMAINKKCELDDIDYSANGLKQFVEKIEKEYSNFINYGGFAKYLNIDKLLNQIRISTSDEILEIRKIFINIYLKFSNIKDYFIGDVENLNRLLEGINSIINESSNSLDRIQKYNLRLFLENIESTIESLK